MINPHSEKKGVGKVCTLENACCTKWQIIALKTILKKIMRRDKPDVENVGCKKLPSQVFVLFHSYLVNAILRDPIYFDFPYEDWAAFPVATPLNPPPSPSPQKTKEEKEGRKNKLTQNKTSRGQMFKEQTFSSYKRELDFSSHASTRINPKPIFIIPVLSRSNHALHISIFFVCECMHKSQNLFPPQNHSSY